MFDPAVQAVLRSLAETHRVGARHDFVRAAVEATGGVPVVVGWGSVVIVLLDGTVVTWSEDDRKAVPVTKRQEILGAYSTLSRMDPALRILAPQRTPTAVPCGLCGGSGTVTVAEMDSDPGCGECHGVGWLAEPGDPQRRPFTAARAKIPFAPPPFGTEFLVAAVLALLWISAEAVAGDSLPRPGWGVWAVAFLGTYLIVTILYNAHRRRKRRHPSPRPAGTPAD